MKKFLFTLATLLIAGTAFADSYLYINKADVLTGAQYVDVPVKAHFSEYVSAWQVTITLPDGINFDGRADVGQDMTIPYFTDRGRTQTYTLSLSQNGVGGFVAASQQEGFYKLNGTWTSHGAIKWAPGDYDEMIILYLEVTDAYTGGDIMITTEPMSSADPRDIPMAVVDGGRTLPWVDEAITAAEPTLAVDNEENPTQVTTNGVLYYCDETMTPGAWNIVDAPYTLPQATDVEQKLHFMAYTPNDEGKNDSKFVTLEVTIPAKAQDAPEPTITMDDNYVVSAAVAGEDDPTTAHEVELYIVTTNPETGEEVRTKVENPYTVTQTFENQTITFVAVTKAKEGESGDTEKTETFDIPKKADVTAPTPTFNNNDGVITATCANHTVKFYYKNDQGEWVEADSFTLPENNTFEDKTYEFKAYTVANGTDDNINSAEVTTSYTVEGKADKVAPVPTFNNNNGVITATCEGHTVKFYYKNDQGEWVEADSFTLPENNTFEDKTYEFKAYTVANGTDDNINSAEVTTSYTVEGKEDAQAPKPTITEENGVVTVTAPEEGLEVVLYVKNGDNWDVVPGGSYTLPENTSYTDPIVKEFKAITKADGEKYNLDSEEDTYTATVPALTKNTAKKPTIERANLTDATCDIVITPDPNTDGELKYTVDPAAPGKAQTLTYERKDADYTVHVTAWTEEGLTYKASEVADTNIVIPAKPAPNIYEVADPTIDVNNDDPTKTVITITATEGLITATVTDEDGNESIYYGSAGEDGKIVIVIPNGDEDAYVNVVATTTLAEIPDEYDGIKDGEATDYVLIPKYQQTAAPTIDVSFGGDTGSHYANVTFVNNDDAPAVIEYSLDGGQTWNTYTPGVPVVITTYGENTVLARATATGKATSEVTPRTFTLDDDATSVNELTNGKTVAGVRYFNMAGQEMQEANGITIVVTTYTDGTTSAVKVIK